MRVLFLIVLSALTGALAQKYFGFDFLIPIMTIATLILFGISFGETYAEVRSEQRKKEDKQEIWK